jgi:YfiH family protein
MTRLDVKATSAESLDLIYPDWAAPKSVLAFVTTRSGGMSCLPFDKLNLALHVDDNPDHVLKNRTRIQAILPDNMKLQWLEQVHGTTVVRADQMPITPRGDAVYIDKPGLAGVVMTADCLPVFFVAQDGNSAAVAHAGWRGLMEGILERTVECFPGDPEHILVWLGPAIGPCHFEVGPDVRRLFLETSTTAVSARELASNCFQPIGNTGKFLANIYAIARLRLEALGIKAIGGGGYCTFCDSTRFYSYRRDGRTGRFVSLIGLLAP